MDDLTLAWRIAERVRDATVRYAAKHRDVSTVIKVRPRDVTRKIDMVAEQALDEAIAREGLAARVISEELGERIVPDGATPELTVLCDPVDGSNNFVAGIPYYCTTIALSWKTAGATFADIDAAAVSSPHLGTFYAARGKGAYQDDHHVKTGRREGKPVYSIYSYGAGPVAPGLIRLQEQDCIVRTMGSIALDICMVARGSFDAVIDTRRKISGYDVMAASLILIEAGGVVRLLGSRDLQDLPLDATELSLLCISDEETLDEMYRKIQQEDRF